MKSNVIVYLKDTNEVFTHRRVYGRVISTRPEQRVVGVEVDYEGNRRYFYFPLEAVACVEAIGDAATITGKDQKERYHDV